MPIERQNPPTGPDGEVLSPEEIQEQYGRDHVMVGRIMAKDGKAYKITRVWDDLALKPVKYPTYNTVVYFTKPDGSEVYGEARSGSIDDIVAAFNAHGYTLLPVGSEPPKNGESGWWTE